MRINHSNRSTSQPNKILENTNPSVRAIHLTIDGLSGLNKWIRPFINANNNTAATSANTHIPEFLIIPEYKYIPYRGQTFLEKKDLRSWENRAKGQVRELGCGCGGGMVEGDDGQVSVDISIYYPMRKVTFISSLTLK